MSMPVGGIARLVLHPNIIYSHVTKTILEDGSNIFGVIRLVPFAVMNAIPFLDLMKINCTSLVLLLSMNLNPSCLLIGSNSCYHS